MLLSEYLGEKLWNFFLWDRSFMCCRWNVYRSAPVLRTPPPPPKKKKSPHSSPPSCRKNSCLHPTEDGLHTVFNDASEFPEIFNGVIFQNICDWLLLTRSISSIKTYVAICHCLNTSISFSSEKYSNKSSDHSFTCKVIQWTYPITN